MMIWIRKMFWLLVIYNVNCEENKFNKKDGKKCAYSCNNFIKIESENVTSMTITKSLVKSKYTYASTTVKVAIMSREKSWVVMTKNFGDKPISYGVKHILPNKDEAILWFKNKKCKIGSICPPNGDCWGSTSIRCYSDDTPTWVERRKFQFTNVQWSTSFHDTCTLDWSCDYIELDAPIHYDSDGKRFIVIDDKKIRIVSQEPEQLFSFPSYTIYIDKMPKEYEITRNLSCFKFKKSLLCEDEKGAFIIFEEGTKCTVLGNAKYCLLEGEFNRIRDFGASKYASISDLNQIRDAFIVNQERDNYNMFVVEQKLKKMQQFIISIVATLSSLNPHILDNYLKGNFFSRYLEEGVFEICPCESSSSCTIKEFHSPNVKFCANNIQWKVLQPFSITNEIDYVIDDQFKFQGKSIHVEESIIENEELAFDYTENHPNYSIWGSITKNVGFFSVFSDMLVYISLGLSIFNFLRK